MLRRAGSVLILLCATGSGCRNPHASATPQPAQALKASLALPPEVTGAMVAEGDSIFHNGSCVKCHGMRGLGTERAPNLTDSLWIHIDGSYRAIAGLVTTGFTKA